MMANSAENDSINIKDVQEVLALIARLNDKQKEIVLATLRGAVLIADAEKGA